MLMNKLMSLLLYNNQKFKILSTNRYKLATAVAWSMRKQHNQKFKVGNNETKTVADAYKFFAQVAMMSASLPVLPQNCVIKCSFYIKNNRY